MSLTDKKSNNSKIAYDSSGNTKVYKSLEGIAGAADASVNRCCVLFEVYFILAGQAAALYALREISLAPSLHRASTDALIKGGYNRLIYYAVSMLIVPFAF